MRVAIVALVLTFCAANAWAQRFPFEQTFDAAGLSAVEVTTLNGKIEVAIGDDAKVRVLGESTVKVGVNVPADAVAIAQRVAAHPPIERSGSIVSARPPADGEERRAVTLSYRILVPRQIVVRAVSQSGAVAVHGLSGELTATTESAAITLQEIAGATVTTGSGAVAVDRASGPLTVTTGSGGINLTGLTGNLHVHTSSGGVGVQFSGVGDVAIESGSSGVRLRGVNGGATVSTRSGAVSVAGTAVRPWRVETQSGAIGLSLVGAHVTIDAASRSGSVKVNGAHVDGVNEPRRVSGTVGGGGASVQAISGSGSVAINISPR